MSETTEATFTITLPEPIPVGKGAKVSEIVLREPDLGEFDKALMVPSKITQVITLMALTSQVDAAIIRRVPSSLMADAADFFARFTPQDGDVPAPAPDDTSNTLTLELTKPIVVGSTSVSEITLREPTLGELERANQAKTAAGWVIALIAQTAGISEHAARRVPISRMAEAARFFEGFLPPVPETGGR